MLTLLSMKDMVSMGMPPGGIRAQKEARTAERAYLAWQISLRRNQGMWDGERVRNERRAIAEEYEVQR